MSIGDKRSKNWLIYGTWALVVVSIISVIIVKGSYNKLIKHYEKATELDWRPFLNIKLSDNIDISDSLELSSDNGISEQKVTNPFPIFWYWLGESAEADTVMREFSEISYESAEYLAVRHVGFNAVRKIIYINTGSTPLRIISGIVSTLTQKEWEEKYEEDAERFVRDLKSFPELKLWETDVVIMPGDPYEPEEPKGLPRKMTKKLFEKYIKRDSSIIIYPYVYIEYEDFFKHKYNALFLQFIILEFEDINKHWAPKEKIVVGTERYRWDIK